MFVPTTKAKMTDTTSDITELRENEPLTSQNNIMPTTLVSIETTIAC